MNNFLQQKLIACVEKKENSLKSFFASDHFLSSYWDEQNKLYSELEESLKLIEMRKIAETMLSNLENVEICKSPDLTLWNGQELPFYYVRHLCFSGYIILSWNIYDRLTSFYVQMMAPNGISTCDKRQMPSLQKLFENQEIKKKFSPFGTDKIASKFLPYIKISYALRNTLAHEGNNYRNIPLFQNNVTPKYAFAPNKNFLKNLSSSIPTDYPEIKEEVESCSDLKMLLFQYNLKIDTLLATLISHSSDCFCSHLESWYIK